MTLTLKDNADLAVDEYMYGSIPKAREFVRTTGKEGLLLFIDQLATFVGYSDAINKTFELL